MFDKSRSRYNLVLIAAIPLAFMIQPAEAKTFIDVTVDFGAKGDGIRLADGATTSGSTLLNSNLATFTSADVGKTIIVERAAANSGQLITTIAGYVDAHDVNLAAAASVSVPNTNLTTSSTTSNVFSAGTKTFSVTSGLPYAVGNLVSLNCSSQGLVGYGTVSSYSGIALSINIQNINNYNSLSCASWNIGAIPANVIYGTDDGQALSQAALSASATGLDLVFPYQSGIYLTSKQVTLAPTGNRQNVILYKYGDQYDHLQGSTSVRVRGIGRPTLMAIANIGPVINMTYAAALDNTKNNPSNFQSDIENIIVDGRNITSPCVELTWMREAEFSDHAATTGCYIGLHLNGGFGGLKSSHADFFGCVKCIDFDTQGDNYIEFAGLWPYSQIAGGVAYGLFWEAGGGNTTCFKCIFNANFSSPLVTTTSYIGAQIEGNQQPSQTQRDIIFDGNEFMGAATGIYCDGGTSPLNTFHVAVLNSHTTPDDGGRQPGQLLQFHSCQEGTIVGNHIGMLLNAVGSSVPVYIQNSKSIQISGNVFTNSSQSAVQVIGSDQVNITGNTMRNISVGYAGNPFVLLSSSTNVSVVGNNAVNDASTSSQTFLSEVGSSDYNAANANFVRGVATKYGPPVGANSHFGTLN